MGGPSSENKVSMKTGKFVSEALIKLGHNIKKIKVTKNTNSLILSLKKFNPDIVFNALHGTFGEDGSIQKILEKKGFLYTHSGVLSSKIAMDKNRSKIIFGKLNVPTPEGNIVGKKLKLLINNSEKSNFTFPLVIKPVSEGSSVGVKICKNLNDLRNYKMHRSNKYLLEEFIPGRELTVGIMNNKVLDVIELKTKKEFYDYKSKYTKGMTKYIIPAKIPKKIERLCKEYALKIHKFLKCKGVTRTDFRYYENDPLKKKIYVLEINTQPGMTPLSLVPMMANKKGVSFNDLVGNILKELN